jgi:hypothetical protein
MSSDGLFVDYGPDSALQFPGSLGANGPSGGQPQSSNRGTDNSTICFVANAMVAGATMVGAAQATTPGVAMSLAAPGPATVLRAGTFVTLGAGFITGYVGGCYGGGNGG